MSEQEPCVWENYVADLGPLVRELACEARERAKAVTASDFDVGYMAGFHRVVSLMQQQAAAMGLSLKQVGLAELDPDEDLV